MYRVVGDIKMDLMSIKMLPKKTLEARNNCLFEKNGTGEKSKDKADQAQLTAPIKR